MPEFVPTTWVDGSGGGTPITAAELNRMDQAIGALFSLSSVTAAGALGDGVTDDTVAINNALTDARLAGGGYVRAVPGSTFRITAPLVIGSNTVLDMTGCRIVLSAEVTQSNMLNNYAVSTVQRSVADGAITAAGTALSSATAAWTSADIGRTVVVTGAGAPFVGLATTPLCAKIVSVTSATVVELDTDAITTVSGAAVSVYDRDENILVIGGTWDAGANEGGTDGVGRHILRFRRVDNLAIRDVRVECTGGKYAITPGDVTQCKITDVSFATSSDGVHFHGPADGVTIRGVNGTTGDDTVALGCDDIDQYQDVAGEIRNVVVEDVDVVSEINLVKFYTRIGLDQNNIIVRNVRGRSLGTYTAITFVDGTMNNVLVDGVNATGPGTFISVLVATSSTNVIVRNVVSTTGYLCQVAAGFTVGSLILQGATHNSTIDGRHLLAVNGTVTNLSLSDFTCTLPTTASVVRMGTGAVITAAYLSDGVCTGVSDGAIVDAQVASGTLGRAVLRGIRASNIAFGFATQISCELNISDFDITAASGLIYVNGGTLVIRNGQGVTGTALSSFRDSGNLTVRAPDLPIDVDLANSRTTGDRAYNTDAGLACGVGPVMWTGTAWQNLATGATYTPA